MNTTFLIFLIFSVSQSVSKENKISQNISLKCCSWTSVLLPAAHLPKAILRQIWSNYSSCQLKGNFMGNYFLFPSWTKDSQKDLFLSKHLKASPIVSKYLCSCLHSKNCISYRRKRYRQIKEVSVTKSSDENCQPVWRLDKWLLRPNHSTVTSLLLNAILHSLRRGILYSTSFIIKKKIIVSFPSQINRVYLGRGRGRRGGKSVELVQETILKL